MNTKENNLSNQQEGGKKITNNHKMIKILKKKGSVKKIFRIK